jgi:hypothetical protein
MEVAKRSSELNSTEESEAGESKQFVFLRGARFENTQTIDERTPQKPERNEGSTLLGPRQFQTLFPIRIPLLSDGWHRSQ